MNSAILAGPASSTNGQPPGGRADSGALDLLWAQFALIGITVSFCDAIVYYPLRLGLASPPLLIPACVLVMASALLAPLLLPQRGWLAQRHLRSAAMPLLCLLLLAGVLAAFLLQGLLLIIYLLIFLTGARRGVQLLRTQSGLQIFICVAAGCVIGLYLFGTVQSANYAGLYSPEQDLIGTLNHDTTFHTAITFLIQNFGVPSLGVDGMVPIKYHFGSHFWFAALGRMTASEPVFSYGAGVPIVLAPMIVTALFLSAVSVDQGRKSLPAYLLVGTALLLLSDTIGWNSYYISESYSCALIGFLLLLPVLGLAAGKASFSPRQSAGIFAIAILMIPLLTVLKISVGTLWTAAVGYMVLRRYGFSTRMLLTGLTAGVIFLAVFWALSPSTGDYKISNSSLVVPFYFFRLFGATGLSSFAIPLMLLLSKTRLYGGEGMRAVFYAKSDLMFEVTMVIMVLGAIPAVTGIPQDSAVWYFLNVSQWLAMVLLMARFAPVFPWPERTALLRALPVISLAAGLTLLLLPAVYKQTAAVVLDADARSNGALLHGRSASKYFYQTLVKEHVLWGSEFRDSIAATTGARLVQAARRALPRPDRTVAVFIPPENAAFWSRSPACIQKFNSQVSLTGQPSLLGSPPGCDTDAYTSNYGAQFKSRSMSDSDLCQHARQRNIQRVLIFTGAEPGGQNRMIDCGSGKSG
jgi:hypothetical protein